MRGPKRPIGFPNDIVQNRSIYDGQMSQTAGAVLKNKLSALLQPLLSLCELMGKSVMGPSDVVNTVWPLQTTFYFLGAWYPVFVLS